MSGVWVIQHIPCETPGLIADAVESAGLSAQYVRPFEGQPIPQEMRDAGGLIVMGGPMGVYDHPRHPFLEDEMRLIEQALQGEKPVLGVCLGSQLLAATLGAAVTRGRQKEIGWHPVTLLEPARTDCLWAGVDPSFTAFHWHGDVFELPRGALSLASSGLTACQAFRYGRSAYGFLFHAEVTEGMIRDMVATFAEELSEAHIDGREIAGKAKDHLSRLQGIGGTVFRRWVGLIERETRYGRTAHD